MAPEPSHRVQNSQTQAAAADVVRGQIDAIYNNDPHHTAPAATQEPAEQTATLAAAAPAPTSNTPSTVVPGPGAVNMQAANQQQEPNNPYERTHSEARQAKSADWQKYHSAWQSYYQQYY